MSKNSKSLLISEDFNFRISSHSTFQITNPLSNMNSLPQFRQEHRDVPYSAVKFPSNDCSLMQNYRKHFVQDSETMANIRGNNFSQKRISQYFPEVKTADNQNISLGKKSSKRSLQELQMKYSSTQNMITNLSEDTSGADELTENESVTQIQKKRTRTTSIKENKTRVISTMKNEGNDEEKHFPQSIHLIGHVDNILRWNLVLKETKINVLYNVLGYFVNAMDGIHSKEKFVYIRSNTGIILECSYFEIDRPLPIILKDQFVECFGHLIGAQRLRLFSLDVLHDINPNEIQRALHLSQRISHELSNRISN